MRRYNGREYINSNESPNKVRNPWEDVSRRLPKKNLLKNWNKRRQRNMLKLVGCSSVQGK